MKGKKNTKLREYQLLAELGGECSKCKRNMEKLSVDHIVPVNFLKCLDDTRLMYEDEDNFVVICQPCNHLKSGRFDFTNPKTAKLLQKYIEPYLKQEKT